MDNQNIWTLLAEVLIDGGLSLDNQNIWTLLAEVLIDGGVSLDNQNIWTPLAEVLIAWRPLIGQSEYMDSSRRGTNRWRSLIG